MTELDGAGKVIELFARTCERMNDFSRQLYRQGHFENVRSSADIRSYESGWRLEKYVEADVCTREGYVAAWCIELGRSHEGWFVELSVNVSHSDVYSNLGTRHASSIHELERALDESVNVLIATTMPTSEFAAAIEALRRR
jgi:hypothetical protein